MEKSQQQWALLNVGDQWRALASMVLKLGVLQKILSSQEDLAAGP
jgi:hypothetical protein